VTNSEIAGRFVFDATLRIYDGAPVASKMGRPAGDHLVSIVLRPEELPGFSNTTLREGLQIPRSKFA